MFFFVISYYAQGICNFGDLCIYSHDSDTSIPIPDDVCLFYLRSNCINGDSCAKTHKSIAELLNGTELEAFPNLVEETYEANEYVEYENVEYNVDEAPAYEGFDDTASPFCLDIIASNLPPIDPDSAKSPAEIDQASAAVKSYASAASSSQPKDHNDKSLASKELCTFYESNGFCVTPKCQLIHGNYCDLCSFYSLHPFNDTQRDIHRQVRFACYNMHLFTKYICLFY